MQQSRKRRIAALRSFAVRLASIALLALIVPVTPSLAQAAGHVRLKITKASLFEDTLADAVGVRAEPGRSLAATIAGALSGRETMIVSFAIVANTCVAEVFS